MRCLVHLLIAISVLVISCKENTEQNDELFRLSDEGLQHAALREAEQLELVSARISEMLIEPATREKAGIWEPRIKRIEALTRSTTNEVKQLRHDLETDHAMHTKKDQSTPRAWIEKAGKLYQLLSQFRDSTFAVYHALPVEFNRDFPLFGTDTDNNIHSDKDVAALLHSASYAAACAFLSRIQLNIETAGWKCATYCLEQIAYHRYCDLGPTVLFGQNAQAVLPGAPLTLDIGIADFAYTNQYKMEISIQQEAFRLTNKGIVHRSIKAKSTPGIYEVPVSVRFLDQDGKYQLVLKRIEYRVIDTICSSNYR